MERLLLDVMFEIPGTRTLLSTGYRLERVVWSESICWIWVNNSDPDPILSHHKLKKVINLGAGRLVFCSKFFNCLFKF